MHRKPIRTLFVVAAMLGLAATPSFASPIIYNFAVRIGAAVAELQDLTLQSVQPGDVLHGTLTVDTSLPDINASPDVGQYLASSAPSTLSLTIGPYGIFQQETYTTSGFDVRIAENGHGFFGNEEFLVINDGAFVAYGNSVDTFEIRLDSDNPAFLNGTGFPTAVNLGLLNNHSTFEFFGHDAMRPFDGFEFFGTITQFEVAPDVVPEPGSLILLGSGLLVLVGRRRVGREKIHEVHSIDSRIL